MIIGIGTDLADITRVERTLQRYGSRFENRCYTADERRAARSRTNPARRYAMFFAAKEACAKALGTGFRQGVFWRDLRVSHLRSGKPVMNLAGGAAELLSQLVPDGMFPQVDVTLTDERQMAHAVVVIAAVPLELKDKVRSPF